MSDSDSGASLNYSDSSQESDVEQASPSRRVASEDSNDFQDRHHESGGPVPYSTVYSKQAQAMAKYSNLPPFDSFLILALELIMAEEAESRLVLPQLCLNGCLNASHMMRTVCKIGC